MDTRKRGLPYAKPNGAPKKFKSESELLSSGNRSKLKPCMKYFSIDGCPFGDKCHFLHYVPGGYNAVAQMMNLPPIITATTSTQNGPASTIVKSKLCKHYSTPEGCKFGDQCQFAHGEWDLSKSMAPTHEGLRTQLPIPIRQPPPDVASAANFGKSMALTHEGPRTQLPIPIRQPPPDAASAATFGASATAKISVAASLAGPIIGHGGVNSKHICRQTGVRLSIRDHDSDSNLKNIELEGTFDQIKEASAMVREFISSLSAGPPSRPPAMHHGVQSQTSKSNFKTKMCENFTKGSCTYGERCHFAHGIAEIHKTGM